MHTRSIAASVVLATALSSATALASADAATSPQAHRTERAGSYVVDARVNKTEPLQDSKVKIKATVSPAAPGASVTLQVRYQDQKRWKTLDHGRLNGSGKVTFKDKVGSVRERRYRVVKPAGAGHGAGQGTTPKVTVFGWRTLTSLNPVFAVGMFETSQVTVGGTSYPDSVASSSSVTPPGPNHIDYNLNRDCKSLEARYGLSDSSPSTGTASLTLLADDVSKYTGTFGLTQSALVTTDITNVFRITVNSTVTNGGIAVVASPRVLCSF
jgi:NPCBM/NEW2 domain-containing protein